MLQTCTQITRKAKKMSKRTLLMVISLVASLALVTTGTLAYLSDSDKDVNVMTLGNVDIVQNEQERTDSGELDAFTDNKPLLPAVFPGSSIPYAAESDWPVPNDPAWRVVEDNVNVVDKFVTVTNTGKTDAYVRTIVAVEAGCIGADTLIHTVQNSKKTTIAEVAAEFADYQEIEQVTIDGVVYDVLVFTYKDALEPGETTIPSLKQIYMNKAADNDFVATLGETFDVLVLSQAVQAQGFTDAVTALNEAFGPVTKDSVADMFADAEIGSPGDEWPNNNPPEVAETVDELVEFLSNPQKDAAILMSPIDYGTVHVTSSMENVTILGTDGANVKFNFDSTAQVDGMTIQDLNLTHQESSAAFVDGGIVNIDAGASVQGLELKNITASISGGRSSFVGLQEQTADVTITECDITGGKYLVYGSNPIEKLTITDNNLTGISSWVVMLNSADYVGMELTITGNTMDHCTGGVAKTLGSSQPDGAATVFTDNTLTASTGHDGAASKWFTIPGAADTITVSGNTLDGAAFTPGTANGLGK